MSSSTSLASASKELICHDWLEGTIIKSYKPRFETAIKTISWAKDGDWIFLVPANSDPELISVTPQTPKLLKYINTSFGINEKATCATFPISTKRCITIGTSGGQMLVYDLKSNCVKKQYSRANSGIFKVQYSVNDGYFAAGTKKGEINIYNEKSYLKTGTFTVPKSKTLMNFRFHPLKRNIIGGCSEEGFVTIWDSNTSKSLFFNNLHVAPVNDVAFSPIRNDMMISIGMDKYICISDYATHTQLSHLKTDHIPSALDFSPDGSKFAVGFHDGHICMYDIRNVNKHFAKYEGHTSKINQISFFGKIEGNVSEISLPEENIEVSQNALSSTDFLLEDIPNDVSEPVSSHMQEDSFLDAVGINTNSFGSLSITDGVKKLMDSKPDLLDSPIRERSASKNPPGTENIKPFKPIIKTQNASASTPTIHSSSQTCNFPYLSPIQTPATLNIKNDIKETIKIEMEKLKLELKAELFETKRVMRTNTLDLQMFLVKESIKNEDHFDKLWNLVGTDEYMNEVLEENAKLRAEVERLKRELERVRRF